MLGSNALAGTKIESGNGYIYVERAVLSQIQNETGWEDYKKALRAIEDWPDITGG